MNRIEWEFEYCAPDLAAAALKKKESHQKKLEWWEQKKKEVLAKVAEGGIEVQDSVAASYSNTKGAFGPQIKIDATLQRDLTECQDKIMEHHRLVKEYDGWSQSLSRNPHATLKLHHDDWLYFFGE